MKDLDLKGLKCPLPVLKLRRFIRDHLEIGEQVRVQTTDPMAQLDIPHYCNEFGQELNTSENSNDGHIFIVTKRTHTKTDQPTS